LRTLIYVLFFFFPFLLFADQYHDINGFFGERAAGLSGAYTAISDDPSGAYYNPAGLGFATGDSISISASNYKTIQKQYKNVDSPGLAYSQISKNYLPNFIGVIRGSGNLKFGFSIVNSVNESFNRNSQISIPVFSPTINNTKLYNLENYNQILAGPSLGYALSNNLSIGATLYYMEDTQNITRTTLQQYTDMSYVMLSQVDNRRTTGVMPIIGVQYMPVDQLSLGLSLRRKTVMGQNRLLSSFYADSLKATNARTNIDFAEGTHNFYGAYENGRYIQKGGTTGRVPETTEVRFGAAYFASKDFLASFDIIHNTGYTFKKNQSEFSFDPTNSQAKLTWKSPEVKELGRKATTNFALGIEYFLVENISVLLGGYTNFANSEKISWNETALQQAAKNIVGKEYASRLDASTTVAYAFNNLADRVRNEYVNNIGYSFGIAYSSANASISLSILREIGKGTSQIDPNGLSQPLVYDSTSMYLVATSRN
jgi:hypothetical protein